jgi:hypothetical protein
MADLYSNFPPRIYSLSDFISTASYLQEKSEGDNAEQTDAALREFVDFVLTGRYEPEMHQAVVDPTRGTSLRQAEQLLATRDLDSLLGVTDNIVVLSDIFVYPVSNPADTLTTSIHIKCAVRRGDVSKISLVVYWNPTH